MSIEVNEFQVCYDEMDGEQVKMYTLGRHTLLWAIAHVDFFSYEFHQLLQEKGELTVRMEVVNDD